MHCALRGRDEQDERESGEERHRKNIEGEKKRERERHPPPRKDVGAAKRLGRIFHPVSVFLYVPNSKQKGST